MDDLHLDHDALRAAHDRPKRRAARIPRLRPASGYRSILRPGDAACDCGENVQHNQLGGSVKSIVVAGGRLSDERAEPHENQICELRAAIAAIHPVTRANLDWI